MSSNKPYVPVVGDGVFNYHAYRMRRGIVRSLHTDTYHQRVHALPEKDAPIVSVGVSVAGKRELETWSIHDIERESFVEYLLRPTGMGRWKWQGVVPLLLISIGLLVGAFLEPVEEMGWRIVIRAFIPLMWVLIIYMHWRNYTNRTK